MENLVLKVIQFVIVFCLSSAVLSAKDPTSDPNILCSEPERKELVQQFQQMDLDVKFIADFCERFAPSDPSSQKNSKTKTSFLSPKKKLLRQGVRLRQLSSEENDQAKQTSEQMLMALLTSKELASGASVPGESYYQKGDNPEILQNNINLKNRSVYQLNPNNFIESNDLSTKLGEGNWDFSSGIIWQLNLGQAKTSFFETDTGTTLKGNHLEVRLQRFFTPLLLSGISQSYRKQRGTLRKTSLTKSIDLEQFQLLGNFGIAWEADNGLGLRGSLMGGWSENRLNYRLQEDDKAYFSDSIDNGQFTWGFEFGPTFKLMERWRAGMRWQKQNSITTVRFAEGNKATLHPLQTYLIWAEYIVETR
ncbi:MAG: autotransporter outer membrane beta-barrel domain-containing protein [SAR324 cluster bacterium]|nr:autotransporter outer membrane beta-barrel domain-containing protein [SAR324 cluster bacterium]